MSIQSEKVKRWRKSIKKTIIDSMGGKCVICKYDRCSAALALHHLDPSAKDFNFSRVRANPKNWNAIVQELRKCVLLCHNCHTEVHSNIAKIPDDALRFNESFKEKALEKEPKIFSACLHCGLDKPIQQKYCSYKCVGAAKVKICWEDIDLLEEIKTKSIVKIAEELGCSDASVHKRIKKLQQI